MFQDINPTLKEILSGLVLYGIVMTGVGMITSGGSLWFLTGAAVGIVMAFGLLLNMYLTIDRALDLDPSSAVVFMRKRSVFRLILILAAAAIGMHFHILLFSGMILGVMGIKVSAYLQPVVHNYKRKKQG